MRSTFGGFILYLLSFFGCGGDDNYTEPIYPPDGVIEEIIEVPQPVDNQQLYEESLAQWEEDKKAHNNSYQYQLSFSSAEGQFATTTTFIVKEGVLVERSYEVYEYGYDKDGHPETVKTESWKEEKDSIGSHENGFPPKTLDEVYKDCGNIYLKGTSPKDEIMFETKHQGIISLCGYWPNDCADDCFEGVRLESFKWL